MFPFTKSELDDAHVSQNDLGGHSLKGVFHFVDKEGIIGMWGLIEIRRKKP